MLAIWHSLYHIRELFTGLYLIVIRLLSLTRSCTSMPLHHVALISEFITAYRFLSGLQEVTTGTIYSVANATLINGITTAKLNEGIFI